MEKSINKSYYQRNKQLVLKKQKEKRKLYSQEKKEKLLEYQRQYYRNNITRIKNLKRKSKPFEMTIEKRVVVLDFN